MDAPPLTSSPVAISASSLIATLHQTFSQSQYRSLRLDSSSIIVIGPNIDEPFIQGIWDHAYRRSEDQSIVVFQDPLFSFDQLLKLPAAPSNRVFDVFYHLLLSQAEQHGAYLSLKADPSEYTLLAKSKTYSLPEWVLFSDDYALAKDWSNALRQCNIKGSTLRGILSTLSGILLLGNSDNSSDVAEGASLIGIDPTTFKNHSIDQLITACYASLVESVVAELNKFLSTFDIPATQPEDDPNEIVSVVSIVEANHSIHRQAVLDNIFNDTTGINAELKEDTVKVPKTPSSVSKAIAQILPPSMPSLIPNFRSLLNPSMAYLGAQPPESEYIDLPTLVSASRVWNVLNFTPCSDAIGSSNDSWSSQIVSAQIRNMFITEWATKRRAIDFTADFDFYEFLEKYPAILPPDVGVFNLAEWARNEKQWSLTDFYCGSARIWLSEPVWRDLEIGLDNVKDGVSIFNPIDSQYDVSQGYGGYSSRAGTPMAIPHQVPSQQQQQQQQQQPQNQYEQYNQTKENDTLLSDEDDEFETPEYYANTFKEDIEKEAAGKKIEVVPMTSERKTWVFITWLFTFWIPSPLLRYLGGMKRPDVRMAWREKFVIFAFIAFLNCAIVFYMIFLGKIICPDFNKVWDINEVSEHNLETNYFVAVHGKVYDLTKFHRIQHSDSAISTTSTTMMQFAGLDLSDYFIPPLTVACNGLVDDESVKMTLNTSLEYPEADHTSGSYYVPQNTTALHNFTWYDNVFLPKMKEFYKGELVIQTKDIKKQGTSANRPWVIINNKVYDLTNYVNTITLYSSSYSSVYEKHAFLDSDLYDLFQANAGTDITDEVENLGWDRQTKIRNMNCLNNVFLAGTPDFRYSNRCQLSNIILLSLAVALSSVTLIKFIASLQFGGKPNPALQDKFVICQVPCYTEDEVAIRKAVDSLTALKYDNRRKLIVVICDGMVVGGGNDKPTPRIVLDIFGVDPKVDPPPMAFKSVGEGNTQLNYGKVYSGLYEFEGDVVPFLVIVKVGKPSETSKPGNRGKRDSQILFMNFLNRIHYQRPMCPLELEMFHHINNVIGVDPELYEYLFMVDADTSVAPDSLNRLVAACNKDSKIAGICGETSLQNEEKSISTMIQVYEYYISHHLTKAFESIFGSVTCLPGCFSMYRLRTSKKAKPLIISDSIINDYSVGSVDTLHKKNLFSLGEDRYLTTLMSKYFSKMKYTFIPDAHAYTEAPDEFAVLLSQRRRWINSTVHNLAELMRLNNMCGFCCMSMRMVVFIDLVGTIMLPSVCVYLGYLIYIIASRSAPFPLISVIMIAIVYGLQALVFLLRKQWQHIAWMLIYVAAYPVHSFILPIYSFWNMDNFSWGNTRIVVGDKNGKQIVAVEQEDIFDEASIPMETWKSFAERNGLEGAERQIVFDDYHGKISNVNGVYGEEMQDWNANPRGHMNALYSDDAAKFMSGTSIAAGNQSVYSTSPGMSHFAQFSQGGPPTRLMSMGAETMMTAGGAGVPPVAAVVTPEQEKNIKSTIARVLREEDLETTTKRQLRERVEDIVGMNFVANGIVSKVDQWIDEELEKIDDDDE
ncbi:hypothetical protein DUD61_000820 [Geotrichum candidum]|nr:hypothetical protein DUD61_000820 [Geotrichum candidum]